MISKAGRWFVVKGGRVAHRCIGEVFTPTTRLMFACGREGAIVNSEEVIDQRECKQCGNATQPLHGWTTR